MITDNNNIYFVKSRHRSRDGIDVFDIVKSDKTVITITESQLRELAKECLVIGVSKTRITDKAQEAKQMVEKIYLSLEKLKCEEVNFFCYRYSPAKDPNSIITCMGYVCYQGKENKFTFKFISKFDTIDDLYRIYVNITQRFSSDSFLSFNIDDICEYILNHLVDLKLLRKH